MPGPDHRFATRWLVLGDPAEVFDLLADPSGWPQWWGSVHASARTVKSGEPGGRAARVELVSGARLPVLLRTRVTVAALERPHSIELELHGDVRGHARWEIEPRGPYVAITTECVVRGAGALSATLGTLLAPLTRAEFGWALHQGMLGLKLELRRRHAVTAHERAMIPRLEAVAAREARPGAPGALLEPLPEKSEPAR